MTLLVATTNPSKLREIRELLGHIPVRLLTLADAAAVPEPDESGLTFAENARIKATYYDREVGTRLPERVMTVAEDSGLVIDALDGEPGVHSARFLAADATYRERFAEIAKRLDARPREPRTARFVCAIAVARAGQIVYETHGTVEGEIAREPRGTAGFGYDPIFFYPRYGATLAEVTAQQKLAVAHRGVAFRALAGWLETAGAGR